MNRTYICLHAPLQPRLPQSSFGEGAQGLSPVPHHARIRTWIAIGLPRIAPPSVARGSCDAVPSTEPSPSGALSHLHAMLGCKVTVTVPPLLFRCVSLTFHPTCR